MEAANIRIRRDEAAKRGEQVVLADAGHFASLQPSVTETIVRAFKQMGYAAVRVTHQDTSTDAGTLSSLRRNGLTSIDRSNPAAESAGVPFRFVDLDASAEASQIDGPGPIVAFSEQRWESVRKAAISRLSGRPSLVILSYQEHVAFRQEGTCAFVSAPAQETILEVAYDRTKRAFSGAETLPIKDVGQRDKAIDALVNEYFAESTKRLQGRAIQPDAFSLPYEPASSCQSCHTASHRSWAASRHARAFTTLAEKKRLVPECLSCHVTAYRTTNIFVPDAAATRESVSCSSCHGDGLRHIVTRKKSDIRPGGDRSNCVTCHTATASPRFNYEAAFKKIAH